jgi:hypothetical protein
LIDSLIAYIFHTISFTNPQTSITKYQISYICIPNREIWWGLGIEASIDTRGNVAEQDEELKSLQTQFVNQAKDIKNLFDDRLTNDFNLTIKIKEWAYTLEQIMLKHGQKEQTREICTYLVNYLHNKGLREDRVDQKVYDALEEFPQYKNETINHNNGRNSSDLPVENSIYFNHMQKSISLLKDLNWGRLTRAQQEMILERLTEVTDNKAEEARKYYGLELGESSNNYSQLDANAKNNPYDKKITAKRPDLSHLSESCKKEIEECLKELDTNIEIFTKIRKQFADYPPQIEESCREIKENLQIWNKFWYPFGDDKWKRGTIDWGQIAVAGEEYNMNAAAKANDAETTYCKHCREPDDDLDPSGTKGLMRPVSMIPVYNMNRGIINIKTGIKDERLYIWQCKRCQGTEREVKTITKERATDNIRETCEILFKFVNKGGLARALHIWWVEWRRPYRTNESYRISPKLERKR